MNQQSARCFLAHRDGFAELLYCRLRLRCGNRHHLRRIHRHHNRPRNRRRVSHTLGNRRPLYADGRRFLMLKDRHGQRKVGSLWQGDARFRQRGLRCNHSQRRCLRTGTGISAEVRILLRVASRGADGQRPGLVHIKKRRHRFPQNPDSSLRRARQVLDGLARSP